MTIYSERFLLCGQELNIFKYTVPVGKRAIVNSLSFAAYNAPGTPHVFVSISGVTIYTWAVPAPTTGISISPRWVIYGGGNLQIYQDHASLSSVAAGYLFTDTTSRSEIPREGWPSWVQDIPVEDQTPPP